MASRQGLHFPLSISCQNCHQDKRASKSVLIRFVPQDIYEIVLIVMGVSPPTAPQCSILRPHQILSGGFNIISPTGGSVPALKSIPYDLNHPIFELSKHSGAANTKESRATTCAQAYDFFLEHRYLSGHVSETKRNATLPRYPMPVHIPPREDIVWE